jgi:hypothetical protein
MIRLGSTGRRQVLWQIAEIAAILSGPKMIELLEAAVAAERDWRVQLMTSSKLRKTMLVI